MGSSKVVQQKFSHGERQEESNLDFSAVRNRWRLGAARKAKLQCFLKPYGSLAWDL